MILLFQSQENRHRLRKRQNTDAVHRHPKKRAARPPAITTRGMGIAEMRKIVKLIDSIINDHENEVLIENVNNSVQELCSNFPLYDELRD